MMVCSLSWVRSATAGKLSAIRKVLAVAGFLAEGTKADYLQNQGSPGRQPKFDRNPSSSMLSTPTNSVKP